VLELSEQSNNNELHVVLPLQLLQAVHGTLLSSGITVYGHIHLDNLQITAKQCKSNDLEATGCELSTNPELLKSLLRAHTLETK